MIKYILLNMLFLYTLGANSIVLPQIVLDAIKDTECLKIDGLNYPYFIRINKSKDIEIAKKNNLKVSKNILICKTAENCSKVTKELLDLGITNLDLGPFQINYFYQGERWTNEKEFNLYFENESAEIKAREILNDLVAKYGYCWKTLGRYHHYNPKNKKRNRAYFSKLYKYIYGSKPTLLTQKGF